MSLVKTVTMRVLADAGRAQDVLDELTAKGEALGAKEVRMRFRVSGGAEGAAELAAIGKEADRLHLKDVNIRVRVDGAGKAIAELRAVRDAGGGGLISRGISGLGREFFAGGGPPAVPVLGANLLGPAGLAIVPALGAALTELTGLVSGFAAAGAGAVAFAALAKPALNVVLANFQQLHQAILAYQDASANLGIAISTSPADMKNYQATIHNLEPDLRNAAKLLTDQSVIWQNLTPAQQAAETALRNNAAAYKILLPDQKNALNALLKQGDALGNLNPQGQRAVGMLQSLSQAFNKITTAFQPQVLKIFTDGLAIVSHLLPTLTPFATAFANALDPLLKRFASFTASKGFGDFIKQFSSLTGPAVTAIGDGVGKVAVAIGKLLTTMNAADVSKSIGIAFNTIAAIINGTAGVVKRLMTNWDEMSSAAKRVATAVASAFSSMRAGVEGSVRGVESDLHSAASAFDAFRHGVAAAAADVVHVMAGLPGKIVAALGNLGGLLIGAGRSLIGGLISGIQSMIGSLLGTIGNIAGIISSHLPHSPAKVGPLSGAGSPEASGRAITGDLAAGIASRLPVLEAAARKVAAAIAAQIKTELAFAKSVTAAALSGFSLTGIDLTQGSVATGMQSYLDSIRAFTAQLKALSAQHLDKGLLQQLIAAGPVAGGPYAASILSGGVGPVNMLWKQIQQAAGGLGSQAAASVYGTLNVQVTVALATGSNQQLALQIIKVLKEFKRHGGGQPLGIG